MSDGSTPAGATPPAGNGAGRTSPPGRPRRRDRPAGPTAHSDPIRTVARGIGEALITVGVVVLLFVVYELYVTDLFGHQKQQRATASLDQKWQQDDSGAAAAGSARPAAAPTAQGSTAGSGSRAAGGTVVVTVSGPNQVVTPGVRRAVDRPIDGQGFAKIFVPSFGRDYVFTVIEGTSTGDLYSGPGHYRDTQYPGEPGNFSIAGHRVSKGSPFNELGLLASCDAIVVETERNWFVYRVLPMQNEVARWTATPHAHCAGITPQTGRYAQTFGRQITEPADYAQVLPVPQVNSTAVPADAQRLITLTTCHPQFSDAQRMIIHGLLVKTYPKSAAFSPPELTES